MQILIGRGVVGGLIMDLTCEQSKFENEQARDEEFEQERKDKVERERQKRIQLERKGIPPTSAEIYEFVKDYLLKRGHWYVSVDEILTVGYDKFGENDFVHDRVIAHWKTFYEQGESRGYFRTTRKK